LTDFNIATRLQKDALACSMSGTKPYMAPEVFLCALDEVGEWINESDPQKIILRSCAERKSEVICGRGLG